MSNMSKEISAIIHGAERALSSFFARFTWQARDLCLTFDNGRTHVSLRDGYVSLYYNKMWFSTHTGTRGRAVIKLDTNGHPVLVRGEYSVRILKEERCTLGEDPQFVN